MTKVFGRLTKIASRKSIDMWGEVEALRQRAEVANSMRILRAFIVAVYHSKLRLWPALAASDPESRSEMGRLEKQEWDSA